MRRGREERRLTGDWRRWEINEGYAVLRGILHGVGNPERERLFRMNLTLCVHRVLSEEEKEALPAACKAYRPSHLAGGPIEVISETEPGALSTRPCDSPRKRPISAGVWIPGDCGDCPSCLARLDAETGLVVA